MAISRKWVSMSLAMVAARKIATPCINRTGGYRSFSSKYKTSPMHLRWEEFTPEALDAIKYAKDVAVELRQMYIRPECVVLSLLDQGKEGIATDVLLKANCNLEKLQEHLLNILAHQPKTTDHDYWYMIKDYVEGKYLRTLKDLGYFPYTSVPDPDSERDKKEPECRVMKYLYAARRQKRAMGDKLVGEEHLLFAYHQDEDCGRQVFGKLNVRERFLISAGRAIRAELEMKKDHIKEEEKHGRGENKDEVETKKQ